MAVRYASIFAKSNAWYGIERNEKWNEMKILVWNKEDARMEWNGRFQERN